jgi:hypothetical protein
MRQAEALAVGGAAEVEVGRAPQRRVRTRATRRLLLLHPRLVVAVVEAVLVVGVVQAEGRQ